jgi:protein SCO1/2
VVAPAVAQPSQAFKSGVFEPARLAPEFALTGSDGSTLNLRRYRGKVVALAFGFTHCQRVCPLTLAHLADAAVALAGAAADLQVIFVTVDPERDNAQRLREFLVQFHPAFVGATGTREQLAALRQVYGISAKVEARGSAREQNKGSSENKQLGYEVHHSSFVYLIDREGKLRLLVPFGKPAEDIAHDVRLLLSERGPRAPSRP